jgi:iron complex outermembrane receptor protein
VINIISKSARDTQGLLVQGIGGNEEQIGSVRYGGQIDDKTFYRVYTKWRNADDAAFASGDRAHDGWDALRGGFRIDRFASDTDTFTVQGDAYGERTGHTITTSTFTPPTFTQSTNTVGNQAGGNVLARWKHVVSTTSDFTLQLYYDVIRRDDFFGDYSLDTYDVDFQHRFQLTRGNDLIWGVGARFQSDQFKVRNGLDFTPASRDAYLFSAFVQDDLTIVPDRVHLILGSKFEQNSYTGFEYQPSARLLWTPDERNTVWGSVSRAVRTPSRADENSRIALSRTIDPASGLPVQFDVVGNNQVESEELLAYELGYRTHVTKTLSVDATAFYNRYNNLLSLRQEAPTFSTDPLPPHVLISAPWANTRRADTYGFEVAANWNVMPNWRLAASYTWLEVLVHSSSADRSPQPESTLEDNVPRNQAQIRSYYDITKDLEFNAAAYYVETLSSPGIPGYVRVDLGLTWRPQKDVELSVGVQNLLDDRHPEFGGQFGTQSTEMQRAFYGQFMIRF